MLKLSTSLLNKRRRDRYLINRSRIRAEQKHYYEENRQDFIVRNRAAQDRRANLLVYYKSKPCADCQQIYPSYVMHFDHLDGNTKEFNVGSGVHRYSLNRVIEEIRKCEVVCANCHAERTHKRLKEKKLAAC